jgi:flagellar hook assembly protein FlgD
VVLFQSTVNGPVNVTIYDLYGDLVHSDQIAVSSGVTEQYVWDGRNGNGRVVGNGGYICRIHGGGMDLRRKIAVVK